MIACGLDFGTSNSAIGVSRGRMTALAPIDGGNTLMPSAVFFDYEARGQVRFGSDAISAYIDQTEGRLMRALKSLLGSSLIDEETIVGGRKVPLTEVVEIFIRHLKHKAEAFAGKEITDVVLGRPVRFVDGDDKADARAQTVLGAIAKKAGFRNVTFVYEPIAAACHYELTVEREELALIADIGGGTSDFSVIRLGMRNRKNADRSQDVLANTGVHIGGTDFDATLSLASVMPVLGLGSRLVEKDLPMPVATYHELATWATINFAYTHKNERSIAELVSQSYEPEKLERLLKVVRERLGHRLALGVEDAKIALSVENGVTIPLAFVEAGLVTTATRADFSQAVEDDIERLHEAASDCIVAAGLNPDEVDTIFLTGGSSRMPAVRAAIGRAAPAARLSGSSDLLSVALGLTRMAGAMA
jgi:hypothetical chaperone protein